MSSSPCAACKFLRRRCTTECIFSAYFPADNPERFANIHKIFGASNVGKILHQMDPSNREDAVESLSYEADARIQDPVYGCVGQISHMQKNLSELHASLEESKKTLASLVGDNHMLQMIQDPALRAQYNHQSMAVSSPAMTGFEHQQEQYQRQQHQEQISGHIMQQWIQKSLLHEQLLQQQQHKEQFVQVKDEQQKKQLHEQWSPLLALRNRFSAMNPFRAQPQEQMQHSMLQPQLEKDIRDIQRFPEQNLP